MNRRDLDALVRASPRDPALRASLSELADAARRAAEESTRAASAADAVRARMRDPARVGETWPLTRAEAEILAATMRAVADADPEAMRDPTTRRMAELAHASALAALALADRARDAVDLLREHGDAPGA